MALAKRDLRTSKSLSKDNPDWAFSIAYNSMLQSARALMFSMGYRPFGKAQHISAVRFAEAVLSGKAKEIIVILDRMRRKRHRVVYDTSGLISQLEAKKAVTSAEKFFNLIENELKKRKLI
ncbi:MAG: HEPN domain-containing protein [Thermoplasmata archaeon]|nr:MAG: HEPN domain-containing protein [Thermoplasmata archaeon]